MSSDKQRTDTADQITDVSSRLEKLRVDLSNADKQLQSQTEAMHAALLAGEDAKSKVRDMAMSQDLKRGIESAIAQLETRLVALKAQQKADERAAGMDEFKIVEKRAKDHVLDAIQNICTAEDALKAAESDMRELDKIAPRAVGRQMAGLEKVSKSAANLWHAFRVMHRGVDSGVASLPILIKALNRHSADLVEEARAKNKKRPGVQSPAAQAVQIH